MDYHFLSPERFEQEVQRGSFLEHVSYAGNRYGTLRRELDRHLDAGRSVIVEIELEGARTIKRLMPEAVSVFIAPPSLDELARRLTDRDTDTADQIAARLSEGERELAAMAEFDHHVLNDDVTRASEELAGIIRRATGA